MSKRNHIAIVLDNSASMGCIRADAERAFNGIIREVREQAQKFRQETTFSCLKFGERVTTEYLYANAATLREFREGEYRPNEGSTKLWDGVGEAVESLDRLPYNQSQGDVSYLVIVVTDGQENASRRFGSSSLGALIRDRQATDRWTFAFNVPFGAADGLARTLCIPRGNVREWEQTTRGTVETMTSNQVGLGSYFTARSLGQTKVDSFYVTTDMSKVTSRDVQANLDDLSNHFRQYTVEKEIEVKPFVEYKTTKPYVIGSAYYMLTKTEKVQPHKQVLIQEKGKKTVWGGHQARGLIGLPIGTNAKVVPGNHSNYDIYVQSTSVNRKLPRGTKVLVDTQLTQGLQPTWDHTQRKAI